MALVQKSSVDKMLPFERLASCLPHHLRGVDDLDVGDLVIEAFVVEYFVPAFHSLLEDLDILDQEPEFVSKEMLLHKLIHSFFQMFVLVEIVHVVGAVTNREQRKQVARHHFELALVPVV